MKWSALVATFALVWASFVCVAADFYKGQHIKLTNETMLYLQDTPYRRATPGEEFEVLVYRADLGKIYVLGTDAAGMPVTLAIKAEAIEATSAQSPSPAAIASPEAKPVLVKAKVEQATYLVKTDQAHGSAFLIRLGSNSYLVSNYHVLKGAQTAEFSNSDETITLEPSSPIEVATDRDLVRIPVRKDAELQAAEAPLLNQSVDVYGNPGGKQVITQESGKVLGVGPKDVEVSAKFIPGNSGGPIVRSDTGNVIGVATYIKRDAAMAEWITEKTRFAQPRRFGLRLNDSIGWSRTSWSNFCSDTRLIMSAESFLDDAVDLTRLLATNPYRARFPSKVIWASEISRIRSRQVYEGVVAKYNASYNERQALVEARVRAHSSDLGKCLQDAVLELERVKHTFSTEYTRKQYYDIVKVTSEFGSAVDKSAAEIASKTFRFKPGSSN